MLKLLNVAIMHSPKGIKHSQQRYSDVSENGCPHVGKSDSAYDKQSHFYSECKDYVLADYAHGLASNEYSRNHL